MAFEIFDYRVKYQIHHVNKRLGLKPPRNIVVRAADEELCVSDIVLFREGQKIVIEYSRTKVIAEKKAIRHGAPVMLNWFLQSAPKVDRLVANVSDGDMPSLAHVAFSSPCPKMGLIPDRYFHRQNGYQKQRDQAAANTISWADRSDEIVWRGSNYGQGLMILDPVLADNPFTNQRVRMAFHCKNLDIDFRFVDAGISEPAFAEAGFMAERQPPETWLHRKFAIDIDGFSNSWDNIMHRLHYGCCVLKVTSQAGFRQWYYDQLIPYEHFVPIKADLSDLAEQIEWVRSNDSEACDIAQNGQALARSMTFQSEAQRAGQTINKIWENAQ